MVHETIAVRTSSCRFFSSRDGCDWKKQIGREKSKTLNQPPSGLSRRVCCRRDRRLGFDCVLGDWSVSGLLLIASLVPRDARCRISCTGWMGGWMGGAQTVKLLFFSFPGRGCARGGRMCGWRRQLCCRGPTTSANSSSHRTVSIIHVGTLYIVCLRSV